MWLRVEDEDIDEAKHLRVTVSAVEEGKGKKKRKRYQCKVILHGSSKEEPLAGFKHSAWTLKADPRLCGDAQRDLKQKSLGDFRKQKRRREDDNLVDSEEEGGDDRRTSKRPAKKVGTVNMGAESLYPSWQAGTAHSPLSSSFSSKSELEQHVAAMLKIKEDHPEASAAVQDTIDFMLGQHHTIEFLSHALASIRAEMKELLSDLKLGEEAERIIGTMQSGILTILDLLDVGDGAVDSAVGAAAASSSSSSSPSSSSSSSSSSSAAAAPTAREKGAAELKESLKGV